MMTNEIMTLQYKHGQKSSRKAHERMNHMKDYLKY